jgi:hypothetical protein
LPGERSHKVSLADAQPDLIAAAIADLAEQFGAGAVQHGHLLLPAKAEDAQRVVRFVAREEKVPAFALGRRQVKAMHDTGCMMRVRGCGVHAGSIISLEQVFRLCEKALAQGALLAIAKIGELLELGLLRSGQVCGHFDIDAHVQIAMAVALDILNSFPFEPEQGSGLGAGWHADIGLSIQSWNVNLGPESRLDETHGDLAKQIIAVALENLVRLDMQDDVQVSRWSAASPSLSISGGAEPRAGLDPGGDAQRDFGGEFAPAGAVTRVAGLVDHATGALAMRAGLGDAEDAARADDLTAAAAGGAGSGSGTGFGSGAIAGITPLGFADGDLLFTAARSLFKGDLEVIS